jgi:hypothetical protein
MSAVSVTGSLRSRPLRQEWKVRHLYVVTDRGVVLECDEWWSSSRENRLKPLSGGGTDASVPMNRADA